MVSRWVCSGEHSAGGVQVAVSRGTLCRWLSGACAGGYIAGGMHVSRACLGEHYVGGIQIGVLEGTLQVACMWRSGRYAGDTIRATLNDMLCRRRSGGTMAAGEGVKAGTTDVL